MIQMRLFIIYLILYSMLMHGHATLAEEKRALFADSSQTRLFLQHVFLAYYKDCKSADILAVSGADKARIHENLKHEGKDPFEGVFLSINRAKFCDPNNEWVKKRNIRDCFKLAEDAPGVTNAIRYAKSDLFHGIGRPQVCAILATLDEGHFHLKLHDAASRNEFFHILEKTNATLFKSVKQTEKVVVKEPTVKVPDDKPPSENEKAHVETSRALHFENEHQTVQKSGIETAQKPHVETSRTLNHENESQTVQKSGSETVGNKELQSKAVHKNSEPPEKVVFKVRRWRTDATEDMRNPKFLEEIGRKDLFAAKKSNTQNKTESKARNVVDLEATAQEKDGVKSKVTVEETTKIERKITTTETSESEVRNVVEAKDRGKGKVGEEETSKVERIYEAHFDSELVKSWFDRVFPFFYQLSVPAHAGEDMCQSVTSMWYGFHDFMLFLQQFDDGLGEMKKKLGMDDDNDHLIGNCVQHMHLLAAMAEAIGALLPKLQGEDEQQKHMYVEAHRKFVERIEEWFKTREKVSPKEVGNWKQFQEKNIKGKFHIRIVPKSSAERKVVEETVNVEKKHTTVEAVHPEHGSAAKGAEFFTKLKQNHELWEKHQKDNGIEHIVEHRSAVKGAEFFTKLEKIQEFWEKHWKENQIEHACKIFEMEEFVQILNSAEMEMDLGKKLEALREAAMQKFQMWPYDAANKTNVQYCIYQLVQLRALLEVGVGIVRQAEGGNSAVKLHLICRGNSCYKLDLKKLDGDFNIMKVQIAMWFENYQKAYEKQGWKMNPLDWMQLWTELKWESIYGRFEFIFTDKDGNPMVVHGKQRNLPERHETVAQVDVVQKEVEKKTGEEIHKDEAKIVPDLAEETKVRKVTFAADTKLDDGKAKEIAESSSAKTKEVVILDTTDRETAPKGKAIDAPTLNENNESNTVNKESVVTKTGTSSTSGAEATGSKSENTERAIIVVPPKETSAVKEKGEGSTVNKETIVASSKIAEKPSTSATEASGSTTHTERTIVDVPPKTATHSKSEKKEGEIRTIYIDERIRDRVNEFYKKDDLHTINTNTVGMIRLLESLLPMASAIVNRSEQQRKEDLCDLLHPKLEGKKRKEVLWSHFDKLLNFERSSIPNLLNVYTAFHVHLETMLKRKLRLGVDNGNRRSVDNCKHDFVLMYAFMELALSIVYAVKHAPENVQHSIFNEFRSKGALKREGELKEILLMESTFGEAMRELTHWLEARMHESGQTRDWEKFQEEEIRKKFFVQIQNAPEPPPIRQMPDYLNTIIGAYTIKMSTEAKIHNETFNEPAAFLNAIEKVKQLITTEKHQSFDFCTELDKNGELSNTYQALLPHNGPAGKAGAVQNKFPMLAPALAKMGQLVEEKFKLQGQPHEKCIFHIAKLRLLFEVARQIYAIAEHKEAVATALCREKEGECNPRNFGSLRQQMEQMSGRFVPWVKRWCRQQKVGKERFDANMRGWAEIVVEVGKQFYIYVDGIGMDARQEATHASTSKTREIPAPKNINKPSQNKKQNGTTTVHIHVDSDGHGHHENMKEVPILHPVGSYGQTSNSNVQNVGSRRNRKNPRYGRVQQNQWNQSHTFDHGVNYGTHCIITIEIIHGVPTRVCAHD